MRSAGDSQAPRGLLLVKSQRRILESGVECEQNLPLGSLKSVLNGTLIAVKILDAKGDSSKTDLVNHSIKKSGGSI